MLSTTINNVPLYATEYDFIVASVYDNSLWFYGAFNDPYRANEVAKNIHGIVVKNRLA